MPFPSFLEWQGHKNLLIKVCKQTSVNTDLMYLQNKNQIQNTNLKFVKIPNKEYSERILHKHTCSSIF